MQCVSVPARPTRNGRCACYVGAAGALSHPLAGGPELVRVTRCQVGKNRSGGVIAVDLQKPRCAVGHCERTTVQRRRRGKEIEARELIDSRMGAVSAFIRCRDDTFRGRDSVELAPGVARLDMIDASSPSVVRDMSRWGRLRRFVERENIGYDSRPKSAEVGLDLGEHLWRQSPAKIGAQQRVIVVLIAEPWRVLKELGV